jgi:hypothetical protein
MHRETQEGKQPRFPFLRGKRERKRRNDRREHQGVEESGRSSLRKPIR